MSLVIELPWEPDLWLVFVRQSKHVAMANIAQNVNVLAPLMTKPTGMLKQTTWWPLLLFSKYMRGSHIATHVSSAAYEGETNPAWMRAAVDTPWLDVSATISDDGFVNLMVVNAHLTEDFDVKLDGIKPSDGKVKAYLVTGENWKVTNTYEKQNVGIEESDWEVQESRKFAKTSITLLRWKA